jgi:hypothetical protein
LQDDIDVNGFDYLNLRTLAALNRVSHAVHEISLPYLYHRTIYDSCSTFAKSVLPKKTPKGWKYVKYVIVIACHKRYHAADAAQDTCI